MKKFLLLLPVALVLFSCASTQTGPSEKELADAARDKALSVKADIAAKSEFAAAQAVYDEAVSTKDKKAAAAKYAQAEGLFNTVYQGVKAKRDEAQKQLEAARAAIKDVEDQNAELQRIRQGGN